MPKLCHLYLDYFRSKKMSIPVISFLLLLSASMLSAADLKIHFPFDEGAGDVTKDASGTIEGKITGAVWVDGKSGKALQFDGKEKSADTIANVKVDIKGDDNFLHALGGGAFSISVWLKPDSSKDYRKCNEILNTGSDQGPGWRVFYSWRMLYFLSGSGAPPDGKSWSVHNNPAIDKVNNDEWNHVAVTRNAAGIVSVYINGKKAGESPNAVDVVKNSKGHTLTIGAYAAGAAYGFKGVIDEVKIYAGELTQEEIYKEASSFASKSAIKLDGNLDEEIWKKATVFDQFALNGSTAGGAKPKAQTKSLIAYDNEFIYAAFICDEPETASLKKDININNLKVYSDDCVELMIDSDNNRGDFYHILINPLGNYGVLFHTQSGMVSSPVPVFRCQAGVKIEKDKWIVELAIPYSSITLDKLKNTIAVNMARTRRVNLEKPEESSICERGAFNQPSLFKQFNLAGAELSPYAIEVKYPSTGDIGFRGKAIQAVIKTSVKNPTAKSRNLSVSVGEEKAGNIATFNLVIAPNEEKEIAANLPIEKSGVFNVTYNIKEGGVLIYDSTYPVKIADISPLSIEITKPYYRNTFYSTQKADAIAGTSTLRLNPKDFTGSIAEFAVNDKDGKIIASSRCPVTAAVQNFSVPLPANMTPGEYTLKTKIMKDGRQLAEQKTAIFNVPQAKGSEVRLVRTEDDVILSLNGKPMFPIWWWGGSDYSEIAQTGGDGVVIQVVSPQQIAELDKLQTQKMYGIVQFYDGTRMKKFFDGQSSLSKEAREHFIAMVKLVKDHPALLCYYLSDEPEVRATDARILEDVYNLIRENDPHHPVLICNDTVEGLYTYKDAHEMFMPDPYLCPMTDGSMTRPMTYISTFADNAAKAGGGKKFIGNTPQVFDYADYKALNNRAPTFMEERCSMYLAIIHGTRGFSLYKYGNSKWTAGINPATKGSVNYPDLRVGMTPLIKEIKSLAEPLLNGKTIPVKASDPNIHLLLKKNGDAYYLFACNVTDKKVSAKMDLPSEITGLSVISEGRNIKTADGKITDEFKPYDVHLYTTRKDFDSGVTIDKIKADILKEGGVFEFKYK